MARTLALAPSGAAAFLPDPTDDVGPPPGGALDSHSGVTYWTPRRPVPLSAVTNSSLEETPEEGEWTPTPAEELAGALVPSRTLHMAESSGTMAEALSTMQPGDGYLMAMAAAKTLLRNETNGIAHARFADGSGAYLIPKTMEVRPSGG